MLVTTVLNSVTFRRKVLVMKELKRKEACDRVSPELRNLFREKYLHLGHLIPPNVTNVLYVKVVKNRGDKSDIPSTPECHKVSR